MPFSPPTTKTRPPSSSVALWPERAKPRLSAAVHALGAAATDVGAAATASQVSPTTTPFIVMSDPYHGRRPPATSAALEGDRRALELAHPRHRSSVWRGGPTGDRRHLCLRRVRAGQR